MSETKTKAKPVHSLGGKFASQLRKLVGDVFPRRNYRSSIDYDSLMNELARGVNENGRRVRDITYVPCDYLINLAPVDMDDLAEGGFHEILRDGLQRELRAYLNENAYQTNGAVTVRLTANATLQPGYVGLTTSFAAYDPKSPPSDYKTVLHAPRGKILATFEVVDGPQAGESLEVVRIPATIGRITPNAHPDVGFVNKEENRDIGRQHAVLDQLNGGFILTEMTAINGTHVAGKRLTPRQPAPLADGDEVVLGGKVKLIFHTAGQSPVTGWSLT